MKQSHPIQSVQSVYKNKMHFHKDLSSQTIWKRRNNVKGVTLSDLKNYYKARVNKVISAED